MNTALNIFLSLLVATAHAQNPTASIPPVPPILIDIAHCESGWRQFNEDGSVLESSTTDYGYFQINSSHIKQASNLGYDIMTTDGNIAYALYLYKEHGTNDWSASKGCWSKSSRGP